MGGTSVRSTERCAMTDPLIEAINDHLWSSTDAEAIENTAWGGFGGLAEAIRFEGVLDLTALAAVVRGVLQPEIRTVEELDAQPPFTVIGAPVRDGDGVITAWMPLLKSPDGPWYTGDREVEEDEVPEVFEEGNPIVLFRPGVES